MMKGKRAERLLLLLIAALLVLLAGLTLALIAAFRENAALPPDFDLSAVTADRSGAATDISGCLLPEFAGLTVNGAGYAVIGSENAMRELCGLIYPAISEAMEEGALREGTPEEWRAFSEADYSVYLRWHTELPDAAVALFVSGDGTGTGAGAGNGYQSEVFVTPYARGGNTAAAALRSADGEVRILTVTMPGTILAREDLMRFAGSFRNSMAAFAYRISEEGIQPVVTERISAGCILMTKGTAALVLESASEQNSILSAFGLNPDKLYSSRLESDGGTSFVESRGELYVGSSSLVYRATSDNGLGLSSLIGYADDVGLAGYIQAALKLSDNIRSVNRWLTGGDAGLMLTGVYASGGEVRLSFAYAFDNLLIAADQPAFVITFENGRVREASLYTLAVRNQGSRADVADGAWFYRWMETVREVPSRISLVYPIDYVSESVAPEWAGQ